MISSINLSVWISVYPCSKRFTERQVTLFHLQSVYDLFRDIPQQVLKVRWIVCEEHGSSLNQRGTIIELLFSSPANAEDLNWPALI